MSILFIEDWIDLYSSRCMYDPNFMALALTVPKKHGYVKYQNLIKSCKVSEPLKVGQDSKLNGGITFTVQDVCMTQVSWL